jgi:hypothetical protein
MNSHSQNSYIFSLLPCGESITQLDAAVSERNTDGGGDTRGIWPGELPSVRGKLGGIPVDADNANAGFPHYAGLDFRPGVSSEAD